MTILGNSSDFSTYQANVAFQAVGIDDFFLQHGAGKGFSGFFIYFRDSGTVYTMHAGCFTYL